MDALGPDSRSFLPRSAVSDSAPRRSSCCPTGRSAPSPRVILGRVIKEGPAIGMGASVLRGRDLRDRANRSLTERSAQAHHLKIPHRPGVILGGGSCRGIRAGHTDGSKEPFIARAFISSIRRLVPSGCLPSGRRAGRSSPLGKWTIGSIDQ
jgi:hypothetical protein